MLLGSLMAEMELTIFMSDSEDGDIRVDRFTALSIQLTQTLDDRI